MINPPSTNFNNLPNVGAGSYTQLTEGDRCNNYSFAYTRTGSCATYGQEPPPPASHEYDYTASCPPGYVVRWNQFAYSTEVPAASEVVFTASSAPMQQDGGFGAFSSPVEIANPNRIADGTLGADPAICEMSGVPSGCPKSLSAVSQADASAAMLRVGVTMISHTAIPTVNSWQITFNCVPRE